MWSGKRADCRPGLFRLQSITPSLKGSITPPMVHARVCDLRGSRPFWALQGHRWPLDAGVAVGTVVPHLHGMSTNRMHEPRVGIEIARAPGGERPHHAPQLLALVSQHVHGTWGVVRVESARDKPMLLHQLEPIRENGGGNPGEGGQEILE